MFSLYPILPRRGPAARRLDVAPWPGPRAPSTPRPPVPARGGDRALTAAVGLAATGMALLVGTHLFGALPVAAVAVAAVFTRWAVAAKKRPAVDEPKR